MSNPAIVLMTDPSRCNLSDVHHLVEALLEIRQMGQHAQPQAFCDHPAAAKDFVDAYAHAYPQLVLEDREVPTPDHLHSLLATGQIGAFGEAPELALAEQVQRPGEQNGMHAFPIVVLTLGSSPALLEALQQSPTMRESIRLIDVGPEPADALSVSIADAVAVRGLDREASDGERSNPAWPELDDLAGAAKADPAGLALHDGPMSLDDVEPVEVRHSERSEYEQDSAPEPAPVAASAVAVQPAPSPLLGDSMAAATTAEPVLETTSQVVTARPSETELIEPSAQTIEPSAQSVEPGAQTPDDGSDAGDGQDPSKGNGAEQDASDKEGGGGRPGKAASQEDDDVHYPPVGSLIAGADVFYPALDQGGARGALHELASVLLDDGILDADAASALVEAHRGEDWTRAAGQDAGHAMRPGATQVVREDFHEAYGQESADELSDGQVARPLHDSDL